VTTATTTTATTLPTSTTTTAPTTSTKLSFVRPPVGTTKPRPGDTIGVVDPEDGPGLDPMTNIRTVIGTVPRDEDTVTPTLSSTNSASSATPTTIRDTDTSSGTVLTPSSTLTTTDTVGGYPVLGDTPSSVDSGLSALDIIGVGGFVGIGIGACLLFGALVAIVIVCAKRQKTPSQTEQVSSSSEMQSARSQRGNDKEAAPVNDEYVAPPKFTLHDEYGAGEFTTQV
jgi:hypothetical protein